MNEFDVIVVGGGPAGAACAAVCARAGLRVLVLERDRFPREKVCGDVINPNCWPIFQRLGIADTITALPHARIRGVRITTFRSEFSVDFPDTPPCIAIRRAALDTCLLHHAAQLGAEVRQEFAVNNLIREGDGWRVIGHQRRNMTPITFRGRWLVGADGRQSFVARKAGLGHPHRDTQAIAFQIHLPVGPAMDGRVQLHLHSSGYCGIVRTGDGCVNLCIVTSPTVAACTRGDPQALLNATAQQNPHFTGLLAESFGGTQFRTIAPLTAAPNHPCGERVLLVGDALQTLEPFTGQGIYFALRTAELAAEEICNHAQLQDRFAIAIAALYRQQARTNFFFRRLMYQPRWGELTIGLLARQPMLAQMLTRSVVGTR